MTALAKDSGITIETLMSESGVKFGTSGARGLVSQMTDRVCFAYAIAFLEYLREGGLAPDAPVVISGDLRPSTPRIARAVAFAAAHLGHPIEFAGWVPSPALALRGLELKAPAIMITGSHIPDDRNGIKFNTPRGEVTKADEEGVRRRQVFLPHAFDDQGMLLTRFVPDLGNAAPGAREAYLARFQTAFSPSCLEGVRLGVYGHSAVGRDLLVTLYESLGAQVVKLGYSETFIPVDTEAIRTEDIELARHWATTEELFAIVSTDGDSDRPLISDERGEWLRGDVAGILVAQFLKADAVAIPVSCNTAVDAAGFQQVVRTRIGSPFVIEGMETARAAGARTVVGYEANGGFLALTACAVPGGGILPALPTRDAVIVHLGVILQARALGVPVSSLLDRLPARVTASDRDQAFAQERSGALLSVLAELSVEEREQAFGLGSIAATDQTDGIRTIFDNGEVVHLRPSGNAPELRCYAEADTSERAAALVKLGLEVARSLSPALA